MVEILDVLSLSPLTGVFLYTCILYSYRIHLLGGSSYLLRHGGRVWGLRSWADGVMDRGWIGTESFFLDFGCVLKMFVI